ncbi:endonuclease 1-like isoform X1 [Prosopis cineraria]|uniref:endonuclease 1-like isoform X1 n=1 Tax=Prosopis cineraria TaxID=364024 RepID=UPI00240F2BBE|nr:endonuclease 1-like isoform X1 [Prosopis cineraria]
MGNISCSGVCFGHNSTWSSCLEQRRPYHDLQNSTGMSKSPLIWEIDSKKIVQIIYGFKVFSSLLDAGADEAMKNLLPDYVKGDLSALCIWPDQIRILYKYRWTSPLHYINIPDNKCSFVYSRDCHDSNGVQGMCVAGAIMNFTSQLLHYEEGTDDPPHNMTEALLFLSHFVGDIHQPMYVGFAGDEGGNAIALRWFRHKSNLYHVWDKEIIVTALKDYYEDNLELLLKDIARNYTDGIWSDDVPSWSHCEDLYNCVNRWAKESKQIACKWGYKGVESGMTLADKTIQLCHIYTQSLLNSHLQELNCTDSPQL